MKKTNGKRLIENQKKLLSLLGNLKTIFIVNENKNESENENENESVNESENESENKKHEYYYEIKQLHDWFKTIDQTKSLEEQIELLKER